MDSIYDINSFYNTSWVKTRLVKEECSLNQSYKLYRNIIIMCKKGLDAPEQSANARPLN